MICNACEAVRKANLMNNHIVKNTKICDNRLTGVSLPELEKHTSTSQA